MDDFSQNNNDQSNNDGLNRLKDIKEKALNELLISLPNISDISPERRFQIYMSAMRTSNNVSIAEQTLNSAMSITDKSRQAEALSELVNEAGYQISRMSRTDDY